MANKKTKVEIIIPFIKGQKKGDTGYMKKDDAIDCEKEGVVKILKTTIKTKNTIKKTKVEIIIPFNKGQKTGDIRYMKIEDALDCEKEGVVKILKEDKIKREKHKQLQQKDKIKEELEFKQEQEQINEQYKKRDKEIEDLITSKKQKEKKINTILINIIESDTKSYNKKQFKKALIEFENLKIKHSKEEEEKMLNLFALEDGKKRSKVNDDFRKDRELIRYECFTFCVKYLLSQKYKIYLKLNDEKELYFLYNRSNRDMLTLSKVNLNIFLKETIKRDFDKYNKKFSGNDLIEFAINNLKLEKVFDIGFKPTLEKKFIDNRKEFLNKYELGEYETKHLKSVFNKKLDNVKIYETYKFPLVEKLIKHIVGDKRTFYEESIEFLTNDKYKKLLNKYLFHEYGQIIKNLSKTCPNIDMKNKQTNKQVIIEELIKHFKEQLTLLTSDDDLETLKRFNYFSKWFAFIMQNPLFKIPNGLAFITTPGSGKDRFIDWLLNPIFGRQNIKSVGQEDLKSTFAGWLKGVRFVICNELKFEHNSIAMYENLKRIMTNQYIAVNEKHQKGLENIVNFSNWLFFGNNDNLLKIDKGDRRFSVFRQDNKIPKPITIALSPDLTDDKGVLLNPNTLNDELNEFSKYLYHLRVSFTDIESPLLTEEKTEIQEYHKTDIELFIEEMKNIPSTYHFYEQYQLTPFEDKEVRKYVDFKNKTDINNEFISYELLYIMFNVIKLKNGIRSNRTARSFHKALTKEGFKSDSMWGTVWKLNQSIKVRFKLELMSGDNN